MYTHKVQMVDLQHLYNGLAALGGLQAFALQVYFTFF